MGQDIFLPPCYGGDLVDTVKINTQGTAQLIAHRGLSGLETENTAAAFVAAGNRSYFGIETDIWRTADGKFICIHDGRTGRLCGEDVVIEDTPFDKLRGLVLRDTDGAYRNDLRLCNPSEYRKICERYGKVCVPELKSNFTLAEIEELFEIFDGYLDKTCFIAFSMANLELVKQVSAGQSCQFLTGEYNDALPGELAGRGMGVDIWHGALTRERIEVFHRAGVTVNCWTVDDPDRAQELISWGVDQITTDILEGGLAD